MHKGLLETKDCPLIDLNEKTIFEINIKKIITGFGKSLKFIVFSIFSLILYNSALLSYLLLKISFISHIYIIIYMLHPVTSIWS